MHTNSRYSLISIFWTSLRRSGLNRQNNKKIMKKIEPEDIFIPNTSLKFRIIHGNRSYPSISLFLLQHPLSASQTVSYRRNMTHLLSYLLLYIIYFSPHIRRIDIYRNDNSRHAKKIEYLNSQKDTWDYEVVTLYKFLNVRIN